ncbi:MAG: hypothetical protein PH343_04210 [Nitrospira sp.]|nr:hypothetical protein [Nitrospira sp.]
MKKINKVLTNKEEKRKEVTGTMERDERNLLIVHAVVTLVIAVAMLTGGQFLL